MVEVEGDKEEKIRLSRQTLLKQTSADCVDGDLAGSDVLMEGGKAIGQTIGLSAAFLAWDAIDLGSNISDLVRKEGSQAAKVLRAKAAMLESALESTRGLYSVEIPGQ